jgi:Helicase HerA, central domain
MTEPLPPYEKLGAFYLGRPFDPQAGAAPAPPLLYDSRDLLTHAVCVGMTGSGKTGLCVALLEEAAIDGIPALVIDPKGEMGNLLLSFPELRPEDFLPWVDEEEAGRQGKSAAEYAAGQAELWRRGLADWDQDGERIRRFREAAEVAIYTPGSDAGLSLSILSSLGAPRREVLEDADLLGDRIRTLASSLLGLLGIDADPLRSREHILLAAILAERWRAGCGVDLAELVQRIQSPPFDRLGVIDLETFFPAQDRFALALALNNLLAAPSMEKWLVGRPLDVDQLLYTPQGSPRIAVLSIAHLSDSERMSFVSLLLNEVVGWVRSRAGTSSLRALLYVDEVFGFLPPVAEPPSKKPLLTLLKQARAFGLGVVLATQNPADLDYKALSNAGTWFLGRLQTERDKLRVLEGLEGAAAAGGGAFDRGRMEATLAGLGKRTFLLHDVHEPEPLIFQSRWALSYLRGPLTRPQIKALMESRRDEPQPAPSVAGAPPPPASTAAGPAAPAAAAAPPPAAIAVAPPPAGASRPLLSPGVPQLFLAERGRPAGGRFYEPGLLGLATVHFVDAAKGVEQAQAVALWARLGGGVEAVDWYAAEELAPERFDPERDLDPEPAGEAAWGDLPTRATQEKSYRDWEKDLVEALYRSRRLELYRSSTLGALSTPGESERDFRIRLADKAREARDEEKEKLQKRYATRLHSLEGRVQRAESRVEREQEQEQQQKVQTAISFGATALSALFGHKMMSRSNLGRATTAFRGVGRSVKESQDVARAAAEVEALRREYADLESELQGEIDALAGRFDPATEALETVAVRPRRGDVDVRRVALAWAPCRPGPGGTRTPAWG